MSTLDVIEIALDRGETITTIFLTNGWSYRNVQLIERTNHDGVWWVTYEHRGIEISAPIAGQDVASVVTAKGETR